MAILISISIEGGVLPSISKLPGRRAPGRSSSRRHLGPTRLVDGPCATRLVAKYTVTFAIGSPALRPAVIHGADYPAIAAGLIDKNRVARDNRVRMKSEGI
jgi:hypothetical protein